jgi:ABC-type antimicrobial peptide transport system permease subunit
LAGIGIFGIVAYTVSRQTAELGLRIALGASRQSVVWRVTRGIVAVICAGIAIGLLLALSASDLLQGVLFGLPPSDVRVYVGAAVVLLATGAIATVPPVLRALRIHPVEALRSE